MSLEGENIMFWKTLKAVDSVWQSLNDGIETMDCRFGKIGILSSYNAAVNILVFLSIGHKEREDALDNYIDKISFYFDIGEMETIDIKQTKKDIDWLIESRIDDVSYEMECTSYVAIEWCLRYYATVIYKNNREYTIDEFTHDLVEFFFLGKPQKCEYSCFEDIVTHLYHYSKHGEDILIKEMRKKYPHYFIGVIPN